MFNSVDIYSFIPVCSCIGMGPSSLLYLGTYETVTTSLGVLIVVFASGSVDSGFDSQSGQTKNYKICASQLSTED